MGQQPNPGYDRRCFGRQARRKCIENTRQSERRWASGLVTTAWNLQRVWGRGFGFKTPACIRGQPCYNLARLEKGKANCQEQKSHPFDRRFSSRQFSVWRMKE